MPKSKEPASRPRRPAKSEPFLIATNRANVLAMCAGGLIWPAAGYRKHYRDSFDLTPGIPVFSGRIPSKVVASAGSEGRLFDVAIEVSSSWMEKNRPVEGSLTTVVSVKGPIP